MRSQLKNNTFLNNNENDKDFLKKLLERIRSTDFARLLIKRME